MAITCLSYLGPGAVVTMAYHHFQSLQTHALGPSLLAYGFPDHAKLFVMITESNSVLSTVLISLGLRFLVRSILSLSTLFSTQRKHRNLGSTHLSWLAMRKSRISPLLFTIKVLLNLIKTPFVMTTSPRKFSTHCARKQYPYVHR